MQILKCNDESYFVLLHLITSFKRCFYDCIWYITVKLERNFRLLVIENVELKYLGKMQFKSNSFDPILIWISTRGGYLLLKGVLPHTLNIYILINQIANICCVQTSVKYKPREGICCKVVLNLFRSIFIPFLLSN